ncbi:MAG TPA: hypothetical protein VLV83_17505 [Acidobacteriota bacterium]|nr:hypothetical protein [Acidobacteriota bacterium]
MSADDKARRIDDILYRVIEHWYRRVASNYVTEDDSKELGLEPEIKRFHEPAKHRIKFARAHELDVTYGLQVKERADIIFIVASVNNKSKGFDYRTYVDRLQKQYWRARSDKPWTEPEVDHYAFSDLLAFEPVLDESVEVESRLSKADIIRQYFEVTPKGAQLLEDREDLFSDLVDEYCLAPMKRIYAECYRETEPGD